MRDQPLKETSTCLKFFTSRLCSSHDGKRNTNIYITAILLAVFLLLKYACFFWIRSDFQQSLLSLAVDPELNSACPKFGSQKSAVTMLRSVPYCLIVSGKP